MSAMIDIAYRIAENAFKDRVDLAGAPYIEHLYKVTEKCQEFLTSTSETYTAKIVAMLHDLVEDTEWTTGHIRDIFGKDVSEAIDALTRGSQEDYDSYIDRVSDNYIARAVKLADLMDNMDITRLPELTDKDVERLKKYHRSYRFLMDKR